MAQIAEALAELDADKDGRLTFDEIYGKVINDLDEDADEADDDEVVNGKNDEQEQLEQEFKSCDEDGDGKLDDKELVCLMRRHFKTRGLLYHHRILQNFINGTRSLVPVESAEMPENAQHIVEHLF